MNCQGGDANSPSVLLFTLVLTRHSNYIDSNKALWVKHHVWNKTSTITSQLENKVEEVYLGEPSDPATEIFVHTAMRTEKYHY